MARYEYLSNPSILKYIDSLQNRIQWVKIVVLNWQDLPLKAIEGRATAGSISINGKSAVRRTGSLTLVTEVDPKASDLEIMHEVTNINTLIAINKRVQVEIGIKNNGGKYPDFDIFWMPLGSYLISNASVTYNNQGIQVSLKLNDKMSLLNGEAGGVISESLIHSPVITEDNYGNEIDEEPAKIRDLITSFVKDWGEIPDYKIIIDDIPNQVENVAFWRPTDEVTLYKYNDKFTTEKIEGQEAIQEYSKGDLVGYIKTDFTYPVKELSSNAGDTVVSMLDKIKNTLGNFEYFFDMDGIFHFQEIKNYLNEGSSIDNLGEAINEKYFINTAHGKASYNFTDTPLVTSYSNNPQYNQIKNDYQVFGRIPDSTVQLQYHLIIQPLPHEFELNYWRVIFRLDRNGIKRAIYAKHFDTLQEALDVPVEYYTKTELDKQLETLVNDYGVLEVDSNDIEEEETGYSLIVWPDSLVFDLTKINATKNWQLKMYLQAIENGDTSSFGKELIEKIPLMMNVETGEYVDKEKATYYLDGINTQDQTLMIQVPIKGLGIESIGRRTHVINDEEINCLFTPTPEKQLLYYGEEAPKSNIENKYSTSDEAWVGLNVQTVYKSAYDVLRSSIHEHLSYNNNINITTMPIYHLDANQRITVFNEESNIQGDYIIQSITIPLTLNGMMTINAAKAIERI